MQSMNMQYAKIQRKILLDLGLAMTFIDLGLLRISLYCKISYLLADIKMRVET